MRRYQIIAAIALIVSPTLRAQLCQIVNIGSGGSFAVQEKSADTIRNEILRASGLSISTGPQMYAVLNNSDFVKTAAAESCKQGDGYKPFIFYDPNWLQSLRTPKGEDWPKYFVLAHEIGHHQNNNTRFSAGLVRKDLELDADRWASHTLTKMGAPVNDILYGLELLNHPGTGEYPTRCERRQAIIEAYSDEATILNNRGARLPIYSMCGDCLATDGTAGYYVTPRMLRAGAPLQPSSVLYCGTQTARDLPRGAFRPALSGMCAVGSLPEGTLLTWDNLGVCDLMRR